jgi:hypothetical protein
MKFTFNPITGKLDIVGNSASSITKADIIHSILLDKDENASPGQAYIQIIFDEDSILYNDDEV